MNKTADNCPHCGEKPVYNKYYNPGSPDGPGEHHEEIFCSNPECSAHEDLESWNVRVNKEAEFLEELKEYCDGESEVCRDMLNEGIHNLIEKEYNERRKEAFDEILELIEQFQAEQKVDDVQN